MGLWGIITGANKAGDVIDTSLDVVKTGVKGLDAMFYTDEEKAVDAAKTVVANMDHVVTMAKLAQNESGASAITRRLAALIVLGLFSIFALVGLVFVVFEGMDTVKNIVEFAKAIRIGELTMTVIVSIFGYYSFTKNRK